MLEHSRFHRSSHHHRGQVPCWSTAASTVRRIIIEGRSHVGAQPLPRFVAIVHDPDLVSVPCADRRLVHTQIFLNGSRP